MATTVWDLLHTFPTTHSQFPLNDGRASTSKKEWADRLHSFDMRNVTCFRPTLKRIDGFLGPDLDHQQPSGIDSVGAQNLVSRPNAVRQAILSEGDVERDFYQNFEPAFRLAFSDLPFLWPRSLVGPTGPTNTTVTVDYQLTWPGHAPLLERAAMIGEFKKPHVIRVGEWNGIQEVSQPTKRLQREMRGYAHYYDCPQVFVFDSVHLLILQFKAQRKEEILSPGCKIDCCVIPRELAIPEQSTIQYGLYRLAWRGWMRLSASLVDGGGGVRTIKPVVIDNITRVYEGWSGRPMWEVQRGHHDLNHPYGWQRQFVQDERNRRFGCWIWVSPDGRVVRDTEVCLQ